MVKIIGVRFRHSGKTYYFDPQDLEVSNGDAVIVETSKGIELGTIKLGPMELEEYQINKPLKPVVRKATEADLARVEANKQKEIEAVKACQEKAAKHELDMKVVGAEYAFDGSKMLFYFTADGRIDFRELVKELASIFHTRIELRQIGVRDETKMMGGIGICGRELCCTTYLDDFAPVSIKMAKEQNLSLNPTKISGMCGRLMCCLKNEEETYEYLNATMPKVGDVAVLPNGTRADIESVNIFRQQIRIVYMEDDTKERRDVDVSEVEIIPRKKGQPKQSEVQKQIERNQAERQQREAEREQARQERQEREEKNRAKDRQKDKRRDNRQEGRRQDNGGQPGSASNGNSQNGSAQGTSQNAEGRNNKKKRNNRNRNRGNKNNSQNGNNAGTNNAGGNNAGGGAQAGKGTAE